MYICTDKMKKKLRKKVNSNEGRVCQMQQNEIEQATNKIQFLN
jgi:hypothetical protein